MLVIASRSVHVDAEGNECSDLNPRVVMMVVAKGCPIDEETAKRYGLIPADESQAPAPKTRGRKVERVIQPVPEPEPVTEPEVEVEVEPATLQVEVEVEPESVPEVD